MPLGIILKNENKSDEMVHIMEQLHSYVPAKRYVEDVHCKDSEEAVQIPKAVIHPILFGGDQLTAARARGAKSAKVNSYDTFKRLDGLIPIAEDWHTKLNFLGICKVFLRFSFHTVHHFSPFCQHSLRSSVHIAHTNTHMKQIITQTHQ